MKNKKLFAILTLVCFMFTLMPVAAFAAPAEIKATTPRFVVTTSDAVDGTTYTSTALANQKIVVVNGNNVITGSVALASVDPATEYYVVPNTAVGGDILVDGEAMTGAEITAAKDAAIAKAKLSGTASVFATAVANEEVLKEEAVRAQITLKNVAGTNLSAVNTGSDVTVYVWAETTANQVNDALVVAIPTEDTTVPVEDVNTGTVNGVWAVDVKAGTPVAELDLSFLRAGTYTLKASLTEPITDDISETDLVLFEGANAAYRTVKVSNAAADTSTWGVNVAYSNDGGITTVSYLLGDGEKTSDKNKDKLIVSANGVSEQKVVLTVSGSAQQLSPVASYPVVLDTNSSNIEISKTSAYANHNGEVEFTVAGLREGVYYIYVTVGEVEATIEVQVGASIANDIEVVKVPEGAVATDEDNYDALIQFEMTDVNGNVVINSGDKCTLNPTVKANTPYVTILEQPAQSDIKDKEIYVTKHATKDVYVLELLNGEKFDVEGDYAVKVILDNGRSAVAEWTVKKFVKPVAIKIDAPEVVELDTEFAVELTFVDVNGVEKTAKKDVNLAVAGYAAEYVTDLAQGSATVVVKDREQYAGSVIKLTAVSERYDLVAVEEVKVAKEATAIEFAKDNLEVNVNNKVAWDVVDEDGTAVTLNNIVNYEIDYIVLDKPEGAKVSVYDATGSDFDGDGVMAITSNKVGNVTVQVVAKLTYDMAANAQSTVVKYYTGTQMFAIGTEGVGDVVVMSVGSNQIVKNDEVATMIAAPMIQNDRTFVPFRALAEAFGAEVAWDEATQSVTAELNGVKVVMTIGSATYTANGVEKTADVAPFINGASTMVPVRFVAQEFGIKVIPTYDENGATADILFNL